VAVIAVTCSLDLSKDFPPPCQERRAHLDSTLLARLRDLSSQRAFPSFALARPPISHPHMNGLAGLAGRGGRGGSPSDERRRPLFLRGKF